MVRVHDDCGTEVVLDDPREPSWFCPNDICPPTVHTEDTSEVNL